MFSPPWTDIGRLQAEVDRLKNDLHSKVNDYEHSSTKTSLARVERDLGGIRTEIDGLLARIEALELASEQEE